MRRLLQFNFYSKFMKKQINHIYMLLSAIVLLFFIQCFKNSNNEAIALPSPYGPSADYSFTRPAFSECLLDTPRIVWIAPAKQNSVLRSPKVNIRATVKSISGINKIVLYVNDVLYGEPEMVPSTTEAGSYNITKSISLEPGNSSLYMIAANNSGTTKSEKRYFTYSVASGTRDSINQPARSALEIKPVSTEAPVIIWSSPSDANLILRTAKANIKATVKSPSGISNISIYINDVLYGEPEMSPSTTEAGAYIISKTLNLEPGSSSVYLTASNSYGTTTSQKRVFSYSVSMIKDTVTPSVPAAPLIFWTSPSDENSTLKSPKANIKATVKSFAGINNISIYLNDVRYGEPEMIPSPTERGYYILTKEINFTSVSNSLYFVASNSVGSTTSEKRYLRVELDSAEIIALSAPTVSWSIPSVQRTNLNSSATSINASIKSTTALSSVIMYVNGVSQGTCEVKAVPDKPGSYTVDRGLTFNQVENNIYLEVINEAGGITRSQSRYFICPLSSLQANRKMNVTAQETANKVQTDNTNKAAMQKVPEAAPDKSVAPVTEALSAPEIIWTSPSGIRTTMESFSGTVKAKIKSASGLKSVLLYQNGISKGEAEIKPSAEDAGSFMMEKYLNFGPGENSIYIVATNNAGASKSELRYFTNPSAVVPSIRWSNPDVPNSVVNSESVKISACIISSTDLRSVKLLVNGNILLEDNIFQPSGQGDCNYNWQSSVILREGDNSIFIVASNAAGSTTSEKRVIKLTSEVTEKRLALVVGNSNYKNSASLKNPVNDANLIEATLKELGFNVIKRLDAGRDEMLAAIREFEDKLANYNVALFYYAGHGNQVDGRNYLIPVDARLEKPSDCKFEAIEVNLVVDEFERYQNNTNIVILDACRNNPFRSWARGGEAGFRAMNFTSGTIVAFATSEGTTAADGKGDNGLYTEELVNQMMVPQSINDVFMNTRVQVRKKSNNLQVPSETNKLNGPFFFKK